jgi:N-methylhydantoinase A/oxoprolinase/acetone carboxylase beta subunit/N-methylhydantoinase B/oxoprolinase/acetone carboxylase alpha subunit
MIRVASDIGGTFTDLALERDGRIFSAKVPTTQAAPDEAVIAGLEQLLAKTGTRPDEIGLFIHGTTLATNAVIERKGARTVFVGTEGLTDSLEIGLENRFDQYNLNIEKPRPLVPRPLRFGLRERMAVDGSVIEPLDAAALQRLEAFVRDARAESVAVCLLHAYLDDSHERRVGEHLRSTVPGVAVSLASEVSPIAGEYERASTVCANAYVQPLMARYLARLQTRLTVLGVTAPMLVMMSEGGLTSVETACRFPVRLIESGPAGGALLAASIGRRLGIDRLFSFDMGGTTAKICLIDDGVPEFETSFEVDRSYRFRKGSGLPLRIPVVDLVEIGAGGGSIARIDALGTVRIGPDSAGSEPGPACFGRGGLLPTVTDADLVVGKIDPARFAGGAVALDESAAVAAISSAIGTPLGLDAVAAAAAVGEMVDENMANAAHIHATEKGKDIAGYTMVAFGGAAPLHALRVAEKLGITRVIIPPNAGVGSAIGFLVAPVSYTTRRTHYMRLADLDPDIVRRTLEDMRTDAEAQVRSAAAHGDLAEEWKTFMRYVGQGHDIAIRLDGTPAEIASAGLAAQLAARFEEEYRRQFGRTLDGNAIEIVGWAYKRAILRRDAETIWSRVEDAASAAAEATRDLYDPVRGSRVAARQLDRAAMTGEPCQGPLLITEAQTTILIPEGFAAARDDSGCIVVERRGTPAAQGAAAGDLAHQIMWNRLLSVVEEQAQALIRTSFSSVVREAGDLSAGVFTPDGRMIAQAVTGTPGHVNSMAQSVFHFLAAIPLERWQPGDVGITNDPWSGTGHLNDFCVVTPAFRGGRIIGFFACTTHLMDVGGQGAGFEGADIWHEGLRIPIMKLIEGGVLDTKLVSILTTNVRLPQQAIGDIMSLVAANHTGGVRLERMCEEFGLADIDELADYIFARSAAGMRQAIAALKAGTFHAELKMDGVERPIRLAADMTIGDGQISVALSGELAPSLKGINVPYCYTDAYASYGVRCLVGPDIPNNFASLSAVRIEAPAGSILNATDPAPVTSRHMIGQMLPDLMLGCLSAADAGLAPAEGSGSLWNVRLLRRGDATHPRFITLFFHAGGVGARPGLDGLSATAYPSGVRSIPVELAERNAPVLYLRKELRTDSGGAGRWRGGLGQVIELTARDGGDMTLAAIFERVVNAARGRHGGADGTRGRISLKAAGALAAKGLQTIPGGDTLVVESPGGGGLGDPLTRPVDAVRADVVAGYCSAGEARAAYGVVLRQDLSVDEPATTALRKNQRLSSLAAE